MFVEFEPQTRIEGDIQQLPADFPVTEMWRVLSGQVVGRESREQVTVFDSVGFAIEDFSALRYLYDLAQARDIGAQINLIPDPVQSEGLVPVCRRTGYHLDRREPDSRVADGPELIQNALTPNLSRSREMGWG